MKWFEASAASYLASTAFAPPLPPAAATGSSPALTPSLAAALFSFFLSLFRSFLLSLTSSPFSVGPFFGAAPPAFFLSFAAWAFASVFPPATSF